MPTSTAMRAATALRFAGVARAAGEREALPGEVELTIEQAYRVLHNIQFHE